MKQSLFLTSIILLTSCKTIDTFDISHKTEIRELNDAIQDFRKKNNVWPGLKDIDSIRLTNIWLNHFSNISLRSSVDSSLMASCGLKVTDVKGSLSMSITLSYDEFEDPVQWLNLTQILIAPDSERFGGYSFYRINSLILQKDIRIDNRKYLKASEKQKFRKHERLRKQSRQLLIQDLKSNEKTSLKIGAKISLYSSKDPTISKDPYYPEYERTWVLTTLNKSDTTIDVDIWNGGLLKRRLKIKEMDSLKIRSRGEVFKILGIGG